MTTGNTVSPLEKSLLVLLLTSLAFIFNWQFLQHCSYKELILTNDVGPILNGYNLVPHLFPDSLRWWHGSWIQVGIPAFRPLTAYLYWTDCYLGMHYGFIYSAWLGFALLVVNCLISSALAWRFTGSKLLMVGAGILAAGVRFYNVPMSPDWLKWFPGHQELFMNAFLLGAVLCFDIARVDDRPRFFIYSWTLFVIGCFAKETVYIFPVVALALILSRRQGSERAYYLSIASYFSDLCCVGLLWVYRKSIIAHPRTPELHNYRQLLFKPMDFMYTTFYRYTASKDPEVWFAGLALLIFLLAGGYLKLRKIPRPETSWIRWLFLHAYLYFVGSLLIIGVYILAVGRDPIEICWWLFDPSSIMRQAPFTDMCDMILIYYYTYLFFKYRRIEPTAAIWMLLFLEYAPVITFIGWHYTMPAWFVQSAYLCVIAKLMWIDYGKPFEKFLTQASPLAKPTRITLDIEPAPAMPEYS